MSILWTGMTAASILFGIAEGRGEAVAAAAVTGEILFADLFITNTYMP